MLRKTLTILSLIGLLLSVGLWGMSYVNLLYNSRTVGCTFWLAHGNLALFVPQTTNAYQGWYKMGFSSFSTNWTGRITVNQSDRPTYRRNLLHWSRQTMILTIPLWIPTVICAPATLALPFRRRRKRKRLGLCIQCGYDLRGSQDRCPECNTPKEVPKCTTAKV